MQVEVGRPDVLHRGASGDCVLWQSDLGCHWARGQAPVGRDHDSYIGCQLHDRSAVPCAWDDPRCLTSSQAEGILTAALFFPALFFAKLSLFLMYHDLFRVLRWVRLTVILGVVFHTVVTVTALGALLALIPPRAGETFLTHSLTPEGRISSGPLLIAFAAAGFAVDMLLFVLPLVAVSRTQLPPRRKLGVLLAFMVGLLCVFIPPPPSLRAPFSAFFAWSDELTGAQRLHRLAARPLLPHAQRRRR